MKTRILSLVIVAIAMMTSVCKSHAKIKMPHVFGDNMVLQQNTKVLLYGKGKGTINVIESWNNVMHVAEPEADQKGKEWSWVISLETQNATFEPQTITIKDEESEVTLSDILIGEVWLASGQSNMEMPLQGFPGCGVVNGLEEIFNASTEKGIRFFTVPLKHSYDEEEDVEAEWTKPSASTAGKYSAVAWYYAKYLSHSLNVPVGIVSCAYGGTKVESWMSKELLESYGLKTTKEEIEKEAAVYMRRMLPYNAMFKPICGYTYKGIIFYQGESNVGEHETYAERLRDMVGLWRKMLNHIPGQAESLPFYYVEIAPYCYDDPKQEGTSAFLREAQFKAMNMIPNSGMISTCDLVKPREYHNIHPGDKKTVGQRLAALSLNQTYGMKQFATGGPIYKELIIEGNEAFVGFDNLPLGICSNYMIEGFEIAGEDKVFYPADKVWLRWQTNHVAVSSEKVAKPVAVRYCFKDFSHGTLYGGYFMPAYPFRTDNF